MVKQLLSFIKYRLREGRLLNNVKKCHSRTPRVLISYTVIPFLARTNSHTNMQESLVIAELFDQLGYRVDVIHYTNNKKLNYADYDIVFGFGEPFENSFHDDFCNAKRIYYATGAHVQHQNIFELNRVIKFNQNHNANLLPKRLVRWCWSLSTSFSDYLIVIGNEWTVSTYKSFTDKPILPINATALINDKSNRVNRNISISRKNFLWFGSSGLIHKGLDLCLEYFSNHPEYILHICGPLECDFFKIMRPLLSKPNIFYHGFVDVNSEKFINITSDCLFSILPSCSEGQATSLLTSMGAGLIPIATRYTGIDVVQLGFLIDSLDVNSISLTISKLEQSDDHELKNKSNLCMEYVAKNHTLNKFKENMAKLLAECVNEI